MLNDEPAPICAKCGKVITELSFNARAPDMIFLSMRRQEQLSPTRPYHCPDGVSPGRPFTMVWS